DGAPVTRQAAEPEHGFSGVGDHPAAAHDARCASDRERAHHSVCGSSAVSGGVGASAASATASPRFAAAFFFFFFFVVFFFFSAFFCSAAALASDAAVS